MYGEKTITGKEIKEKKKTRKWKQEKQINKGEKTHAYRTNRGKNDPHENV